MWDFVIGFIAIILLLLFIYFIAKCRPFILIAISDIDSVMRFRLEYYRNTLNLILTSSASVIFCRIIITIAVLLLLLLKLS